MANGVRKSLLEHWIMYIFIQECAQEDCSLRATSSFPAFGPQISNFVPIVIYNSILLEIKHCCDDKRAKYTLDIGNLRQF